MKQKIKGLEEASIRIKKAVQEKERIILYGDSDLDGISSVVILEEAIKSLGGSVDSAFFPDRERDGYGINLKALDILKKKAPALFITLDLGISNIKEVDIANKMGFEVIIIDHHETLTGIPNALVIVDPKQKTDKYSFKGLANVGVTFNLCEELLGSKISKGLKNSFLELAALGTIADMVPQVDQNKKIIEEGLRSLKNTYRPALRAFFNVLEKTAVFGPDLQKIISALNAAESIDFENESYKLLVTSSAEKCEEIVRKLFAKNQDKQIQIRNIVQETERRILQKSDKPIVFEGDRAWRLTLAGSAASILCNKYQKPVFIFRKGDKESCGSVRNPSGTNSVEAMKSCNGLLMTYGGHAQASGFRIKNENLDEFEKCLTDFF
jgi:single-stranded-DNA-specific exonuclease